MATRDEREATPPVVVESADKIAEKLSGVPPLLVDDTEEPTLVAPVKKP